MTHPLVKRAREEGTPIIEGEQSTFVWHGRGPVKLAGDFDDWDLESSPMLSEIEPKLWTHTMTWPRDSYMEYAFVVDGERALDPLNPRTIPSGLGHINNFFYMPEAAPTPLIRRQRGVPRGLVSRHTLETDGIVVGKKRAVYLYQPPTSEPCPLVVVYDGTDYMRRAKLPDMVDNLIAQKRIRPVALAMVANGGKARMIEYACSEMTVDYVVMNVLPLAYERLNLLDPQDSPGAFGVLGASMGGLMALYTAMRAPQIFGRALSQSGAFMVEHEYVVCDLVRHMPMQPIKIWMDVGRFEMLLSANQHMRDLLVGRDYDVAYREFNAGHNYPAWRNDVWRGLEALFGV